jgi:hypothetical protein
MVPFYIPHNSRPDELALRIMTFKKQRGSSGSEQLVDEKSVTLDKQALDRLVERVQIHKLIAERPGGKYILIRAPENVPELGDIAPDKAAESILAALSHPDIVSHITTHTIDQTLADALRATLRLQEIRRAIGELRSHLDTGVTREGVYQDWCVKHSWAFGITHVGVDQIHHIGVGDTVDLLMPTLLSGHRDIVELKRPDMEVLGWDKEHRDCYFSLESSKAIGQVHRYLDVAAEQLKTGLTDHPEVVAYHPRATIVIGRSNVWSPQAFKGLHGLNSRLHGITVMTFDQLLAQAERLMAVLTEQLADEDEPF